MILRQNVKPRGYLGLKLGNFKIAPDIFHQFWLAFISKTTSWLSNPKH